MSESLIEREIERIVESVAERIARGVIGGHLCQSHDWLTESELADLWQCSRDTIRSHAMRQDNPLPYGTVGEIRRYHRADFDDWARAEGERDRARRLEDKKQGGGKEPRHLTATK